MHKGYDFLVIGGGIAGVAVASELALHGTVCILERENTLAYHTTGRSAAILMESYGNALIRTLTCASRSFFENPLQHLSDEPLCSSRGALIVSDEAHLDKLNARYHAVSEHVPSAEMLDQASVIEQVPFLTPGKWVAGIYEPNAIDLDVHAIHSAFVKSIRLLNGEIRTQAEIVAAHYRGSMWRVTLDNGEMLEATLIVNAAGAWADPVAAACGASTLGVRPLSRTVVVIDPAQDVSHCPYLGTVDEQFFIKPDVGRLMVSPCDEIPTEPCDALPGEIDVAITMDRLESATTLRPKRILNRWAGLRVFVPDRSPVVGADPIIDSFFWYAALGGYGIQTAPALARLCASLALGLGIPPALKDVLAADAAPTRLLRSGTDKIISVAELR